MGAGEFGNALDGEPHVLALDLDGHVLVIDPAPAVADDLVAGLMTNLLVRLAIFFGLLV